ncbi:MAG: hypothetical protein GAK31_01957 [Stenotrophomonas maltophilia]|uniref:DNA-binding protein n=1 Tax=Stenotrophomonas maltophilia TaxID=40324 RepID=A0A7V8FFA1_STEMA|nr:MAG: hypothetical protein GAK31_01957 [Stenotrophomonas maltophilia]
MSSPIDSLSVSDRNEEIVTMTEIAVSSNVSITSREIAELVEKRHDNVKRTIETLAKNGAIRFPQIEES